MIKIHTIGGYDEIGRNMTAVQVDDEIIVLDMGINLQPYIKVQEENISLSANELIKVEAIPDDSRLDKDKVVAIIPSHAHLDHIGAIPYLERAYNAPILCTPFSKALLKKLAEDKYIKLKNPIIAERTFETKHTTIELIPITHSTVQSSIIAIRTKYGTIVYANDFKIDFTPTLGKLPEFEKLQKENIIALICDCLKADEQETKSEAHAKELLENLFETQDFTNKAIIISTFSSHFARLLSIIQCAKKINRKVVFVGRSLAKYVEAAQEAGFDFPQDVEIIKYRKFMGKELRRIEKNKGQYVIVATGHQGEPRAVLSRIIDKELPFNLQPEDVVIFSCTVIPNEENMKNREVLEAKLKEKNITIYKDIHVSGHAAKKGLKLFLETLKPVHLIPAHGPHEFKRNLTAIAKELGYSDEFLHLCSNYDILEIA